MIGYLTLDYIGLENMTPHEESLSKAIENSIGAALRRASRKFRDRPALVFDGHTWTFQELELAANNVGSALLAAGLCSGDRVAAYGRNSDAYFLAWLGCAVAGLVHVPINYGLSGDELSYLVGQSGARAVLCDTQLLVNVQALSHDDKPAIIGSFDGACELDVLTSARTGNGVAPAIIVQGSDLAQIQYTSGTTSAPKGAMMLHRAILTEYSSCIHDLCYNSDDRCLAALPLYHTAQMHAFTMPQLLTGATTWLIEAPDPDVVLQLIQEQSITSFFAPPTVWISLLRHPEFDRYDLSSLTKLYYGASIMPAPVLAEIRERLPNAGPFNVYGQSEIGPVATVLSPSEHNIRPTSAGRPVLHVETRIVDPEMRDLPAGERGEIVHRSPQLLTGYWNKPEETRAAFEGDWFHSGDVGVMDEDGYIYVVDRLRDVINTGGVLVAGCEVEDVLFTHSAVREVAVIGLPDAKWIEAVTAVVVVRPGKHVSDAELISHARGRIAPYKVPKRILFVEDLPRNASGKVLKRDLRTRFAEQDETGAAP